MIAANPRVHHTAQTLRTAVAIEISIGIVIGAIILPSILWFADVLPPAALFGVGGMLMALTLSAFFQVMGTTLMGTLVLRQRVRRGSARSLHHDAYRWLSLIPRNLVGRALIFTLLAVVALVPLGLAVCWALHLYPLSKSQFAALNVVFGAVTAVLATPFVAVSAMTDQ
jgi:hypothetical protein